VTAAISIIMALATGLIDALPRLITAAPRIIRSLVDALLDNLPLLIDAAITLIIEIAKALIDNLPLIVQAAVEIIGALVKALIKGIPQILGVIPKLFGELVKGFAAIDWGKLGTSIIDGIKNGVSNAAKGLADSVVNAANSALSGVKDFLGIRSPSRVMRDEVGTMIGAGMAQGITRSTKQVQAAMGGLTEQMMADGPDAPRYRGQTATANTGRITAADSTVTHTGTIRVEGINDRQQLIDAVEVLVEDLLPARLRREARFA
jgi:phage-related protein